LKVLISEAEIRSRVADLGRQITADYHDRPLTVLGVLKGSIVLLSDLIRQIAVPHRVGLLQASSYRGATTTAGDLIVQREFLPEIAGRDILLLDDIFDTGRTLAALLKVVEERQPRSLRSAVLLWKTGRQSVSIVPDYYGFQIPDVFVVGYGLDYDDDYRHLPYVAALQPEDLPANRG
jgi:hypoxanthine phosphoribosyltransferase